MRSMFRKVMIGPIFVYPTPVEATCNCIWSLTFHMKEHARLWKDWGLRAHFDFFSAFKVRDPIVSTSNPPENSDHWIELRIVKFG